MIFVALVAHAMAACAWQAGPAGAAMPGSSPVRAATADSLVRERRYLDLECWLALPGARAVPNAALYQGILDNRRNRNARSLGALIPLLASSDIRADSAHRRTLLETIADDYGKLYRYGDAARTLRQLDGEFGSAMPADARMGLAASERLRELLAAAPAQRTTVPSVAFGVPLRHSAIGTLEIPAQVGADSAWWIVDSGANFSAVTESVAARLHLAVSKGSAATHGISGNLVSLHVALVPNLTLGRATIRNMVVLVLPDSALYIPQIKYQMSMILGYPALEALRVVTIGADRLTVSPAAPRGAVSELFLEQLDPVVGATVDGRTDLYHLDTGADQSVFTQHFRDAHPGLFSGLTADSASLNGVGGSRKFRAYELSSLRIALGTHVVTLPRVRAFAERLPASFDQFFGNLGRDILDGASLTFDFRQMKVVLSR